MTKGLISIPRIVNRSPKKETIEWEIPQQVSVVLMFIEKFGYTLVAKVKVPKKHWWNRSWKSFITHASTIAAAVNDGQEFLEPYGYEIDNKNLQNQSDELLSVKNHQN